MLLLVPLQSSVVPTPVDHGVLGRRGELRRRRLGGCRGLGPPPPPPPAPEPDLVQLLQPEEVLRIYPLLGRARHSLLLSVGGRGGGGGAPMAVADVQVVEHLQGINFIWCFFIQRKGLPWGGNPQKAKKSRFTF